MALDFATFLLAAFLADGSDFGSAFGFGVGFAVAFALAFAAALDPTSEAAPFTALSSGRLLHRSALQGACFS